MLVTVFAGLGLARRPPPRRGRGRRGPLLEALVAACGWSLGCIPYFLFLASGGDLGSPAAWSQIGFLMAYPFWYLGLWKMRQPALEESRRQRIESLAIEIAEQYLN